MSVGMSNQKVAQDMGTSVLKMAMGSAESTADMLNSVMAEQHAAQPYLGSNLDIIA